MRAWHNPNLLSFAAATQRFAAGTFTPRDLLEQCIDNIERLEPTVGAFVIMDLEAARKSADASTARYRAGQPLSPVDGCPIGIKDIIATCDLPTQMGSPAFKGVQLLHDAACIHALRTGGAVIVGKTVTTEFAIGLARGTTNPFDPTRTPGGSSSGSGAAVGAGMLPVAIATQTQASTLRPASYCGAFGFKPTYGSFRMEGVHVMSPTSDHVGVIGANLDDIWRVASRIALSVGGSGYDFMQGAGPLPLAVQPKRLIRLYTRGWDEMDDTAKHAFEDMAESLAQKGVTLISKHTDTRVAALEESLEANIDSALEIVVYEMQWPFADYIKRYGDLIGPRIHSMIKQAQCMSRDHYTGLLAMQRNLKKQFTDLINDTQSDGVILPASSGPAPVGLDYTGSRVFASYANLVGFPAFTLPLLQAHGLPFGVQLFDVAGHDSALCARANWVIQAFL